VTRYFAHDRDLIEVPTDYVEYVPVSKPDGFWYAVRTVCLMVSSVSMGFVLAVWLLGKVQ
jgi:hypothetical protein